MGITRTELFSDDDNRLAFQLKALAHPARLSIVRTLLEAPAVSMRDLSLPPALHSRPYHATSKCWSRRGSCGHGSNMDA